MDTIKINKRQTQLIAHAGHGLEMANTCAGFIAAGNRSYAGIETDLQITADMQVVTMHNPSSAGVSPVVISIPDSTLEEVQNLPVYDHPFFYGIENTDMEVRKGSTRPDLRIASLEEYIRLCKKYGKIAVPELKGEMTPQAIAVIVDKIRALDYLENTIFISFCWENLVEIRRLVPGQTVQFLTGENHPFTDEFLDRVAENGFDLDIHIFTTTREVIERIHARGIKVNVWTIDWPDRAEQVAAWGADYITTNILE